MADGGWMAGWLAAGWLWLLDGCCVVPAGWLCVCLAGCCLLLAGWMASAGWLAGGWLLLLVLLGCCAGCARACWLAGWLAVAGWLAGGWMAGWLLRRACWLAGWLAAGCWLLLASCLLLADGWLSWWLAGWLDGWMIDGWLVDSAWMEWRDSLNCRWMDGWMDGWIKRIFYSSLTVIWEIITISNLNFIIVYE